MNSLNSKQLVAIESGLPGNIVSTTVNEDTKRRRTFCPETGFSFTKKSRKRKFCAICGKPAGRSLTHRECYNKARKTMVVLKCTLCGIEFRRPLCEYEKRLKAGQEDFYCSVDCSRKHHAIKHSQPCHVCGKPVKKGRKYCSRECRLIDGPRKKLPDKSCDYCGTVFRVNSNRTMYCSKQCQNAAHSDRMKGQGNSHFKTGTSYAKQFREMRKYIAKRDRDACCGCGKKNFLKPDGRGRRRTDLAAHHINEDPTDNHPENLVMLCSICHSIHHHSNQTPFPGLAEYAKIASQSMTSEWKERTTSLLMAY